MSKSPLSSMEKEIDDALASKSYDVINNLIGSSYSNTNHAIGGSSYGERSLGPGEQRTLCAYFVKAISMKDTIDPSSLQLCQKALKNIANFPIDGAADNVLRQKIFEFYVEEEGDYQSAAEILSTMRMTNSDGDDNSNDPNSSNNNSDTVMNDSNYESRSNRAYFYTTEEMLDVYVSIAECYLECGDEKVAEADAALTKAGTVLSSSTNNTSMNINDTSTSIIKDNSVNCRYKSVYARVLDINRKFLPAALRYYELSKADEQFIDAGDLLSMLGRATTCAILAQKTPQQQRILGLIVKDDRLVHIDSIEQFKSHSTILKKMYMNQFISIDSKEWIDFEHSLTDSQRALTADFGLTYARRALMEHNMLALSHIYANITFQNLGTLLGTKEAEQMAAKMITEEKLPNGTCMDEIEKLLIFGTKDNRNTPSNHTDILSWDQGITTFCAKLNRITDTVRQLEA